MKGGKVKNFIFLIALLNLTSCFEAKDRKGDSSIRSKVEQNATEVVYTEKEFNEALFQCTHDEDRFMYVKTFEMSVCSEHIAALKDKGLSKNLKDFEKIIKAQANMLKELEKTSKDLSNGREECSQELKNEYFELLRNADAGNPLIDRLERKAFNPIKCQVTGNNKIKFELNTNVIGTLIRQVEKKEITPKLQFQSAMMGEHFTSPTSTKENLICGEFVQKFNEFNKVLIEKSGLTKEDLQDAASWVLGMRKIVEGMKAKAPDCEIIDPNKPTNIITMDDIEVLLSKVDLAELEKICRVEIWRNVSPLVSPPSREFSEGTVQADLISTYENEQCLKISLIDFINGDLEKGVLLSIWED